MRPSQLMNHSPAAAMLAAAGTLMSSTTAHAQLSTTPPAAELPAVVVETEQKPKKRKAPSAAQQSSTPRASEKPGVVSNADPISAVDTSDVAGSPTSVTTPVDQIASSVTVITSKEIEAKQYRTVPEALRSVPGLNIVSNGGPGSVTSVFMRGTNSNHTKVLVDGIEINDPSSINSAADLAQLLTSDIDRIEVLRGPQSGLYGADAVGGVIAIFTKKGEGPPKVTSFVEGGSFGTFNQGVSARGSVDRFNYSFNVAHFRADDVPVTPRNIVPPGNTRFNNDYDNWTYATKLGYEINDTIEVNAVARYTQSRLFYTGDVSFDDFQSRTDIEQLFTRGEGVVKSFGGRMRSYFGVNYTSINNDVDVPPGFFGFEGYNDGDRIKYDWRSVLRMTPQHTMIVGAEHRSDETRTDNNFGDPFSADEWNRAAFAEMQSEVVTNLFLVANIRLDDNETFGEHTTWRVAPAYVLEATGTKIKGSVGTAFKAPTLAQRFQDFPSFGFFGNPDLQPEESTGYDVGFEQSVLSGNVRFGATYFYNDITDLIIGGVLNGVDTNVNVKAATTEGVELFAAADISENFRVRGDYTYTNARDETLNLWLQRRPRDKASVSVGWTPYDPLLLTATVLYVGDSADVDRVTNARVISPDYTLVNVAADYKLNNNMSLYGRIDNLFDRQYENPDGYLQTGIGAYVGVRLNN